MLGLLNYWCSWRCPLQSHRIASLILWAAACRLRLWPHLWLLWLLRRSAYWRHALLPVLSGWSRNNLPIHIWFKHFPEIMLIQHERGIISQCQLLRDSLVRLSWTNEGCSLTATSFRAYRSRQKSLPVLQKRCLRWRIMRHLTWPRCPCRWLWNWERSRVLAR